MPLRYTCLILDHDDTAVNSTAAIHYPAHLEVMGELRPDREPISLRGWFEKNFSPGIMEYMQHDLGFSDEEIQREYEIWREFTSSRSAPFFPGFLDVLREYKKAGGIITVISHSEQDLILRDYRAAGKEASAGDTAVVPELVYGWDFDETKRKPHPWPVIEILRHLSLDPEDALIVDDLRPAVEMGKAAGVDVAAAGWAHDIPVIREYMEQHCVAYFAKVEEFGEFLFR